MKLILCQKYYDIHDVTFHDITLICANFHVNFNATCHKNFRNIRKHSCKLLCGLNFHACSIKYIEIIIIIILF